MSMTPNQINNEIDQILSACDGTAYPMICRRCRTEAGRNYVKSRMIHLIVKEGIDDIDATLPHIEQELQGL